MPSVARSAVAPLYLFACLVLGGSAQGIWQNAVLQLMGLAIIGWAALAPADEPPSRPARRLLLLTVIGISVVVMQTLPIPPAIWADGSRERIIAGYQLLGISPTWQPISVSPYGSLATLFFVIPPIAMYVAIVRRNAYRPNGLAAALIAGSLAGLVLGALQVTNAGSSSRLYLYPVTNTGRAVGFFANASHMAMLLVITAPFLAATVAAGRGRNLQHNSALIALSIAAALLLVVGIALNGSLAGKLLIVPVTIASSLIVLKRRTALRRVIAVGVGVTVIFAVAGLAVTSIGSQRIGHDAETSVQSRVEITKTTVKAIRDFMPWGSGLGSFVKVYHLYESPDVVTNEYVVHAHNDYVELLLELGAAGGLLLILFLAWWGQAVSRTWRTLNGSPFAYAASISSAALLLHSLVEFPLRTAALSACFAMFLGLLADRRQPPRKEAGDLRPTRHIVIR